MTKKSDAPAIRFKGFSDAWEQRKLGDMMNVTSVKRIHQSDWTDSGVRFLRARDIVAAAKNEEPDDYLYISKEKYEEYSALSGKVGVSDLLVTGVGTIGVPYLVRNLEPLYFKDGNIIWFQNSDKIDGKFLFYSFSAEQIQGFINESAGIGTVGTYTIESGKKTPISLPNQIEQAKVGEFFQQLDNLITLHQRKFEKLTNVKKSMLEKMFPQNGSSYPEIRFKGFTDPWEQRKLGDMMNVTSVKRIHQSDWTDSGVRFLRARDIVAAAKNEEPDDYLYISKEKYEEYSALSGKVGVSDLLVTGVGTIGVPYLVRNLEPLYFKDGNIIWFQNSDKIDGKFLFYSFSAEQIQGFINESAGIGTVGTYTIESGKKTPISLPNQIEQAKVGEFFQQLDNLITLHQRKFEKLTNVKKSMLEKMFPQNGSSYPEIRFKGFTDPWEQRKLASLCEKFTDGDWIESKDQSDFGVRLVQTGNVGVAEYLDKPNNKKWISEDTFDRLHCEEVLPGDILISRLPEPAGRACIVPLLGTKMITAVDCTIVRTAPDMSNKFLVQYLSSQAYFDDVNTCLAGGTRQRISRGNLANFNVPIPVKKSEQDAIGMFFGYLDNLITLHQRELEKLQNIKKSMLEKMFV